MLRETQVKSLSPVPFGGGATGPSSSRGRVAASNSLRYSRGIMKDTHATQAMTMRPVEDGERGVRMAGIFRLLILPAEEAGPDLS